MSDLLKIYTQRNFYNDTVELHFYQNTSDDRISFVKDVIMENVSTGIFPDDRPLKISTDTAQNLMDQLWNIGIRPVDVNDRNDVVNAKDKHIKDLQKIMDAFLSQKNNNLQ